MKQGKNAADHIKGYQSPPYPRMVRDQLRHASTLNADQADDDAEFALSGDPHEANNSPASSAGSMLRAGTARLHYLTDLRSIWHFYRSLVAEISRDLRHNTGEISKKAGWQRNFAAVK